MSRRKRPAHRSARKSKPGVTRSKPADGPAMSRIRILLVDDHPVVREGLHSCLSRLPQLEIIGEAASGEDALRQAVRLKPDLVLMDINMPGINGLVAAARLRKLVPAAKVLILSVHENREYVAEVSRSGARGYILKDAAPAELVRAIEAVHRGEVFFSPLVAAAMLDSLGGPDGAPARPDASLLTAREREVLELVATGASSKTIAAQLGLTYSSVRTYRERLMRKLNLHSIAAVTQFAIAEGFSGSATKTSRR